jgi:RecA-family ATPase
MINLDNFAIDIDDLSLSKSEFLVDDFLVKEAITMIYGAASQGKTWFMYALVKLLANDKRIKKIYYIDMDNPKRQLIARGVDKNLLVLEKVKYITKSSLNCSSDELLEELKRGSFGRAFEDVLFVFDSTRDFVEVKNDRAAREFMEVMKSLREAGGTVILIHHATKSGRYIEGSAEFSRAADNVYELKQRLKRGKEIHYALKVENDRDPIKDKSFIVNTSSFSLIEGEDGFEKVSLEDERFIKKVIEAIDKGIRSQGEILAYMGKKRDDKSARRRLEKYIGSYWDVRIDGRKKIYILKESA